VTKCDTNTRPRRLATHLLQQVVQSLTSRRHSGHGSATTTRNNTKAIDQTAIAKASKASLEYHTMEALCGDSESTGTVGCRAATYSTSSGTKSGSSSEKQLVKQGWAKTYSTSSAPPTEGLINRSCTWYIKDQVKVYLQTHLLMQGFILEKVFANHFYNPSNSIVLGKPLWDYRTPRPRKPRHTATHFSRKQLTPWIIPNPNTSFVTTPCLLQYRGHGYSNWFYTLQRLYIFTHK
jgi:hypothetical protein